MNKNILLIMEAAALVIFYGGPPTYGFCPSGKSSDSCEHESEEVSKPPTSKPLLPPRDQEVGALFNKISSAVHKLMGACFAEKMFELGDANKDGFLSLAEMRSLASKIQPYMFNDKFNKENDKNKDGKLSLDEVKVRSELRRCCVLES